MAMWSSDPPRDEDREPPEEEFVTDPLQDAIDIADQLNKDGREEEALELLDEYIIPALRERGGWERPQPDERPEVRT
jgi:thioredoxin-like negative regulator of GroEL